MTSVNPPSIEVTSPITGSKVGLYGSQANQLILLDSLKTATVINTKVTPMRRKLRTGLFAASIIGHPTETLELTDTDRTRIWNATAIRWVLWTTRQHWKSTLPKSQRSSRDLLRTASRTALYLSFDPEVITEDHVEAFLPDFSATFDNVKALRKASKGRKGWAVETWDREGAVLTQRVFEEKSGVKVKQWLPWGWSSCANIDDLRILVGAHTPAVFAEGEILSSEKEPLLQ